MVHKSDCVNLKDKTERIIDVFWNDKNDYTYPTEIYIETIEGKNYMVDILGKATMLNIMIDAFKTKKGNNSVIYVVSLKIKNKEELDKFINSLEMLEFVKQVSKHRI